MTDDTPSDAESQAATLQQMRARTAIDERMIELLVRSFYARIPQDDLLGPIFAARVQDWEPHLQRMCSFWSSVMLSSGAYNGQPLSMHLPLPIDATHFDRWLALFEQAARELFNEPVALQFTQRAQRIARSLELGIASNHDILLGKDERFRRRV